MPGLRELMRGPGPAGRRSGRCGRAARSSLGDVESGPAASPGPSPDPDVAGPAGSATSPAAAADTWAGSQERPNVSPLLVVRSRQALMMCPG
ncbi:MAG TPA: hypothetical protein VIK57_09970 [Streptosporangiaceae bacterium]